MKRNINVNSNTFYYFAIFLLTIKSWFFFSNLITIPNYINVGMGYFIILLFMIKILTSPIAKKNLLFSLMIFFIMMIIANVNDFINLFLSFLAVYCSKGTSLKKTIKIIFYTNFVILLIHLSYFTFKYFNSQSELQYLLYKNSQKRWNCFIRHPNYVAAIMFWTLSQYVYLYPKNNKLNIIIAIFVTMLCYGLTKSRTTIISFLILILYLVFKNKINSNFLKKTFYIVLFGGLIVTLFMTYNFNTSSPFLSDIINNVDEVLSHRITYSAKAIELYPITFFGSKIDVETAWYGTRLMIDSFYISCLVEYGICLLFIVVLLSCKAVKKLEKEKLFFYIMIFIVALTERYLFYISLCFPFLFLETLTKNNNKEGQEVI